MLIFVNSNCGHRLSVQPTGLIRMVAFVVVNRDHEHG